MCTRGMVGALLDADVNGEPAAETEIAAPVRTDEVGVICMNRAQAICVRNLLRQEGFWEVNVGTVDDFQGQELRVIFVTSVLSHGVWTPTLPVSPCTAHAPHASSFQGPVCDCVMVHANGCGDGVCCDA